MQADGEGTRRLRATLRALMSGGVWLVVVTQLVLPLMANMPGDTEGAAHLVRIAAVTLMLLGLLYLIAGASRALALGRDPVSIVAVLRSGKPVFIPFLWLLFKTGLLAAVILQLGMLVGVLISGLEATALVEHIAPYTGATLAALGFVLVYWMPIVFADNNFVMLPTLAQAFRVFRARLRFSGYLAFLTLTPALIAVLIGGEPSGLVIGGLNLVGGMMGWIAYVYCVEWRQSQVPGPDAAAASLN